ncbi:MAG: PAS domain S-box protein, partial [Candidatus Celaenobacter antarcticus]|nr:PAS domain S-box protein [Candidatus Celaenobacter antarcticus]
DITERKQIEEVLKDNEDRYRQIYQFSPDSVIIHDMDMNILDANNKAVEEFGYSKEELLKKKIFDLHPETELKHSAQVLDAMKKKEMMTVETEFVRKNGSVFLSESTPCKYTLGSKSIIHVVIRDITEKRKIEEDIKKRMNELEIFNDITVGRELKMLELKKEINELLKRMGKKEKYEIVE